MAAPLYSNRSVFVSVAALALVSCGDDGGGASVETSDQRATAALARALSFAGGEPRSGDLPSTTDETVRLEVAALLERLEPAAVGLMPFDVTNPDADNAEEAVLIQFEDQDGYTAVPTSASVQGPGELNLSFSLEADVCDGLCPRRYTISFSAAIELADAGIGARLTTELVLDCRGSGDADRCESGEMQEPPPPPTSDAGMTDASVSDGGTVAQAPITQLGGRIELADGTSADVPRDAVTEPTTITLSLVEDPAVTLPDAPMPADFEAAGRVYAFEPHGATFEEPVTVTLPFEGDAEDVVVMKLDDPDDTTWEEVPDATLEGMTMVLETRTFCFYWVVRRVCALFWADEDGDGYGNLRSKKCTRPAGHATRDGDCNDRNAAINPGATETCAAGDENCNRADDLRNGSACDDGSYCTATDTCQNDQCRGSGARCEEGQHCNEDQNRCDACQAHADCDDDVYCNGGERCDADTGTCGAGAARCADGQQCDEQADACVECTAHAHCDDGLYCNGTEQCEGNSCVDGTAPSTNDGIGCTTDSCDESSDSVVHTPSDAACGDGAFCNGAEVCNLQQGCQAGSDPCPTSGCNETSDQCFACTGPSDCSDGLYCNGAEVCNVQTGECGAGTAPTLDDGQACTVDTCNEAQDSVEHTPNDAACGDGLYCNGTETCSATLGCQAGTAPSVDDGVACTTDACNEQSDSIDHTPEHMLCNDALYCNGTETCSATLGCQAGTAPDPSDGVPCTVDTCDEDTDSFAHTPNDSACSDPLFCNGDETCDAVLGCQAGGAPCAAAICDEAMNECDPCTADADCEDTLYCNGDETCDTDSGLCLPGTPPSADDDVDCTMDYCDEATDSTLHAPNDGACGDTLYCNGDEVCDELLDCQPGTPPSMPDAIACTADTCDEDADAFQHTPVDAACNDSLYCTGAETCDPMLGCRSAGDPCSTGHCNDTLDACVACLMPAHCDDGLYCNGAEGCNVGMGTCTAGTPPSIDDGVACTVDACVEATDSITHTASNALCVDSLYCNGVETCSATLGCQAGSDPCAGMGCNEGTDSCAACQTNPDCDDGLYCNGAETCDAGNCLPGTPPTLSDGVSCTTDSCDEALDSVVHTPSNATCSDSLYCNGAETCHATNGCQAGSPPTVSDGVSCTTDSCNEGTDTVDHLPNDGACGNGLYCDGAETCHPTNDCQPGTPPVVSDGHACTMDSCNEGTDSVDHTPVDALCNDALYCNGVETCSAALGCVAGSPPPTSDGVACTVDVCNESTDSIDHTPSDTLCGNGQFCDGDETCHAVNGCQPGTPPAVDDGVPCTADACNEGTNTIDHTPNDGLCNDSDPCTIDDCTGTQCAYTPAPYYYVDNDGDGFGAAFVGCVNPGGAVTTPGDCDDGNPMRRPNAAEVCDGIDNDCDGAPDDGVLTTYYYDSDNDGFGGQYYGRACTSPGPGTTSNPGDCNDGSSAYRPGAPELCDGQDNDCDGTPDDGLTFVDYYYDSDVDTFGGQHYGRFCSNPGPSFSATPGDCNDGSSAYHPGASELCDAQDNDCDGTPDDGLTFVDYYYDSDQDDWGGQFYGRFCSDPGSSFSATPGDCNDGSSDYSPDAPEICDGLDNDCNGLTDDGLVFSLYYYDSDQDSYGGQYYDRRCIHPGSSFTTLPGDCNDGSPIYSPEASEICDGLDNDCNGETDDGLTFTVYYYDSDQDGYGGQYYDRRCTHPGSAFTAVPGDCNDGTTSQAPNAAEVCDSIDNDCNGAADDGLTFLSYYYDSDQDGCGGGFAGMYCSHPGSSYTTNSTDCNDGVDGDCSCSNGCSATLYYYDSDGDGFGGQVLGGSCTNPGAGTTTAPGDCNDGASSTRPGATELCDNVDNDCDNVADDGLSFSPYYYDSDSDTYGHQFYAYRCSHPGPGTSITQGDCNDSSAATYPAAPELCDSFDNDCGGTADDGIAFATYYYDSDGDTYGHQYYAYRCANPGPGTVTTPGDCYDASNAVYPGASELCDYVDNDCDGIAEDGLAFTTYYYDGDGDGTGGQRYGVYCSNPGAGTSATPGDCNDGTSTVEPGAPELCDAVDNDCDGTAEDGLVFTTYYYDSDGDGTGGQRYGARCSDPGPGTSTTPGDCNDGTTSVEPGAPELCDAIDNDCDGAAEDGLTFTAYFYDNDGDDFGAAFYQHRCSDPGAGTSAVYGDCNDSVSSTYPGAPELCDAVDNDCDGPPDEGCP